MYHESHLSKDQRGSIPGCASHYRFLCHFVDVAGFSFGQGWDSGMETTILCWSIPIPTWYQMHIVGYMQGWDSTEVPHQCVYIVHKYEMKRSHSWRILDLLVEHRFEDEGCRSDGSSSSFEEGCAASQTTSSLVHPGPSCKHMEPQGTCTTNQHIHPCGLHQRSL